jgi:hypothetical protein
LEELLTLLLLRREDAGAEDNIAEGPTAFGVVCCMKLRKNDGFLVGNLALSR